MPPPKKGISTAVIALIVVGCLFGGCLAVGVIQNEKARRACSLDPMCKAEKKAKEEQAAQQAKDEKASKEEKAKTAAADAMSLPNFTASFAVFMKAALPDECTELSATPSPGVTEETGRKAFESFVDAALRQGERTRLSKRCSEQFSANRVVAKCTTHDSVTLSIADSGAVALYLVLTRHYYDASEVAKNGAYEKSCVDLKGDWLASSVTDAAAVPGPDDANCADLGYRYGRCSASALVGKKCDPKDDNVAQPPACKNSPAWDAALKAGVAAIVPNGVDVADGGVVAAKAENGAAASDSDLRIIVRVECEDAIKHRLNDPDSVDWPGAMEEADHAEMRAVRAQDGTWHWNSWFSATNGFGGRVRSTFRCVYDPATQKVSLQVNPR